MAGILSPDRANSSLELDGISKKFKLNPEDRSKKSVARDHQILDGMTPSERTLFFGDLKRENLAGSSLKSRPGETQAFDMEQRHYGSKNQIYDRLIISSRNRGKAIFDIMILILVIYSCLTTMYYVVTESYPTSAGRLALEWIIEAFFLADLVFNFFLEYRDPNTYKRIRDFKKISTRYLKGRFAFDFLALFPFYLITEDLLWTRLFRLLRLPKFFQMLDINYIDKLLTSLLLGLSKDKQMSYGFVLRNIYRILRLLIIAVFITYFIGCLWYFVYESQEDSYPNFFNFDGLDEDVIDASVERKVLLSCYFTLTTLSTVGYGDLKAWTESERVAAIIIMILGVTFFSYIMGNFSDVVSNYDKKMGNDDLEGELQSWIANLSRFNKQSPIPASLVAEIYDFFQYFWKNYRILSIVEDESYLQALPESLYNDLMRYLFGDIFYTFRFFFLPQYPQFRDKIAMSLYPRIWDKGELIIEQFEAVPEVIFIMEGIVEIGFMHENEFRAVMSFQRKGLFFGDYNVMQEKKSDICIRSVTKVKAYGLSGEALSEALGGEDENKELRTTLKSQAMRRNTILREKTNEKRKSMGIPLQSGDMNTKTSLISVIKNETEAMQRVEYLDKQITDKFKNLREEMTSFRTEVEKMLTHIPTYPLEGDATKSTLLGSFLAATTEKR